MKFRATDEFDYRTLERWINRDFFHHGKMDASWWLDNRFFCCCYEDNKGEVLFIRAQPDGDNYRLSMQFAPEDEVSKFRVAKALLKIYDPIVILAKERKVKGIIFKSTNDPLIYFLQKKGFVSCGDDDYVLQLESK